MRNYKGKKKYKCSPLGRTSKFALLDRYKDGKGVILPSLFSLLIFKKIRCNLAPEVNSPRD